MSIQNWSDDIVVVELADDPQFSDELNTVIETYQDNPSHIVLNFAAVGFINSSNISKLLRLRKMVAAQHRKLMFCAVNTQVWGVFLVTGLDKIFEVTDDISTALTSLQLGGSTRDNK